jgi:hypothetical protein
MPPRGAIRSWSSNFLSDPPQISVPVGNQVHILDPDDAAILHHILGEFLSDCVSTSSAAAPATVTSVIVDDDLLEKLDDAMEGSIQEHYTLPDYECRCGAINNMDGDVLHGHRIGALSTAIEKVLLPEGSR